MRTVALERFKELLIYEAEVGRFRWRVSRGRSRAGAIAGFVRDDGYREVTIDGCGILEHRLVWFLETGTWKPELDHRDLDKVNNRFGNLRDCSRGQNRANTIARNQTGVKGVYPKGKRWSARIRKDGRETWIGTFDTQVEAHLAYSAAAKEKHGEFARF